MDNIDFNINRENSNNLCKSDLINYKSYNKNSIFNPYNNYLDESGLDSELFLSKNHSIYNFHLDEKSYNKYIKNIVTFYHPLIFNNKNHIKIINKKLKNFYFNFNKNNKLLNCNLFSNDIDLELKKSKTSKLSLLPDKNSKSFINNLSNNKNNSISILNRNNIKILTYNFLLRPPLLHNNSNDYKNERLDDFINLLNLYDIICMQEVFGTFNSRKDKLLREATKRGFFYFADTTTPEFYSKYLADGGLVVLSRFPIEIHAFHPFNYGVIHDSICRKGILYTKIRIKKNCNLHLFVTHTQASYYDSSESFFKASIETRKDQIKQINEFIIRVINNSGFYNDLKFFPFKDNELIKCNYNNKIILLGDFNVDANCYKFKNPKGLKELSFVEHEYEDMLTILNSNGLIAKDIFLNRYNDHPITYGSIDPELGITERVLTCRSDAEAKQCLDYVFECFYVKNIIDTNNLKYIDYKDSIFFNNTLDDNKQYSKTPNCIKDIKYYNKQFKNIYTIEEDNISLLSNNIIDIKRDFTNRHLNINKIINKIIYEYNIDTNKFLLEIVENSLLIEDFRINNKKYKENLFKNKQFKDRPYSQLSDHYGLSFELKYNNRYVL